VAVNETLNCTRADFPGNVIFYRKKVPVRPVNEILRALEERRTETELKNLPSIEIAEARIALTEKAEELHISPLTLRRLDLPDHEIIGDQILSHRFLQKIQGELQPNLSYAKVEEILKKHKVTMQVLPHLGYKILWKGLKPVKIVPQAPK
jgi:hypothetical protein